MNRIKNIQKYIFLPAAVILVLYLALNLKPVKGESKINGIDIKGTGMLKAGDYVDFAGLKDTAGYRFLKPNLVKDRLEKHPYVSYAYVDKHADGKVEVILNEKKIKAILTLDGEEYLVSEKLELLPFFPATLFLDYPVISNAGITGELRAGKNLSGEKDILLALKLIEAAKLSDKAFYKNLSEVSFRKDGSIAVFMSDLDYPAVISRENGIRKMVYLSGLWKKLNRKSTNRLVNYVDLRYNDYVYLGITGDEMSGGNRS